MEISSILQNTQNEVINLLFLLEPEVAGELGENTIIINYDNVRTNKERPEVIHLHYVFTGWLGDEILECTPCFIVTSELAEEIKRNDLHGYMFEDVEVLKSDEFQEMYPHKILPQFKRLLPLGNIEVIDEKYSNWSGHDFCVSQKSYLVVTKKTLDILMRHKMDYCEITPITEA